jgi:C1A family cysteine protease
MADEASLLEAVARQPVAVSLYATDGLLRYAGGIFDASPAECPYQPGTSNHALLLVGWGQTRSGLKYWIAKNSWGRSWGLDGYVYFRRGTTIRNGVCGLNNYPMYPII